ncbi:cyclophilin-like fold protein [Ructibacterium gallinarum]|nr:cyclophilin-like fold protein [Ructibacterium gallinarum]
MKKLSIFFLVFALTVLSSTGCSAQNIQEDTEDIKIILTINKPTMIVNDEERSIDNEGTVPIIVNDRTLLPVRAVVEAIGGSVDWDEDSRTVTLTKNEETIKLTIDSEIALLNSEEKNLDTAPTIINNRTMLPIRFIAENFGFNVEWDEQTQEITILQAEANKPNAPELEQSSTSPDMSVSEENLTEEDNMENTLLITIGDKTLTATLADTVGSAALKDLLSEEPITIDMRDYGGFEKVGSLGQNLPTDDTQTTTQAGDIVLYQGNQIVIFYGSNSWSYTRLGKMNNLTQAELKEILGNGSVTITLSLD